MAQRHRPLAVRWCSCGWASRTCWQGRPLWRWVRLTAATTATTQLACRQSGGGVDTSAILSCAVAAGGEGRWETPVDIRPWAPDFKNDAGRDKVRGCQPADS
jgi:hypothetical protein